MTTVELDTKLPILENMIRFFDYDLHDPPTGDADIVPHLPDDPLVQWCTSHCQGKAQIIIGLTEQAYFSGGHYSECFSVNAVFECPRDAVLFKLTWC